MKNLSNNVIKSIRGKEKIAYESFFYNLRNILLVNWPGDAVREDVLYY